MTNTQIIKDPVSLEPDLDILEIEEVKIKSKKIRKIMLHKVQKMV